VNDPALRKILLGLLQRWGRLPETDLLVRLPPVQLARFRPELWRDLAAEGLVVVRQVGDERVIEITDQGRRAAEPTR
jgi:hypothetical protein